MAAGFSVSLSAFDGISAPLDKINKKFAAMTAPAKRLEQSFAKFGHVSGINAVGAGFARMATGMGDVARRAASIVTPLGAITGAASLAGIYRLTEAFGQMGTQLRNDARNVGASVAGLSAMQGAARLAGSSAQAMTAGMYGLADSITDAIGGRNQEALQYFRQLGINIRDVNTGATRTAEQVLPEVADAIAKISDPRLQARVARAFGLSEDLLPYLRRGSQGMREYEAEARRYGAVNEVGARAADMLRQSQTRLTLATEGLGYAVAEKLAPVLSPMLTGLADWVAGHRTDIADTIGRIGKQFSDWVADGGLIKLKDGLTGFWTQLEKAWHGVDEFVKGTVGWKTALEVLAGAWVLNQSGIGGMALALAGLSALKLAPWLLKLLGVGPAAVVALPLPLKGDTADPNDPVTQRKIAEVNRRNAVAGGMDPRTGLRSEPGMQQRADRPNWWQRNAPVLLGGTPVSGAVPAEGRALLDAIAAGESDGSYADQRNPRSGARGRYQFLDSTWREVSAKTGNYEFTPENQDKNAWFYAQERYRLNTGRDLSADMKAGINPASGLNRIWTSLPGGAEPNNATPGFDQRLSRGLHNQPQIPSTPAAVGPYTPSAAPAAAQVPGAPGAAGTVHVEIVNRGAAPGTSSNVRTSGDVTASARIETGMPSMAYP